MSASIKLPDVNKGDRITVRQWDSIGKAVRALRPVAGTGLISRQTGNGTIISAKQRKAKTATAFRCTLAGSTVRIGPGTLNGTKADGDYSVRIGSDSQGWVIIDAEMDGATVAAWTFRYVNKLEGKGTHPIALIDRKNGNAKLYQLTHFNLQTAVSSGNNSTVYFLPQ